MKTPGNLFFMLEAIDPSPERLNESLIINSFPARSMMLTLRPKVLYTQSKIRREIHGHSVCADHDF